jgi:pyruvate kinase
MSSRAQIVATIGPSSKTADTLCAMSAAGMDVARLNFAWIPDRAEAENQIRAARDGAAACGRATPIILADLPARRIAEKVGHTYDPAAPLLTPEEEAQVEVCIEEKVEYFALSFVGGAADVEALRAVIAKHGGTQKIIAKIERQVAVEHIDEIVAAADGIMVARGDLGSEVPLEDIPFVQKMLVTAANAAGKPVIVATQMMLSMTEHKEPTRAEVTDVEAAIMDGADAVMLSEESASGHYPTEAVAMMERIVVEAEKHRGERAFHLL